MKNKFFNFFLWLVFFGLLLTAVYGVFFVWKINQTEKRISASDENSSFLETFKKITSDKEINLSGKESQRINILLLGVAGDKKPGKNLSDTLIIASINLENNKVALLSIPRDLYVEFPKNNFKTKINAIYQSGLNQNNNDSQKAIKPLRETLQEITSLEIHYWAVVNFEGFEKIIDAIGGINITNEKDIYDTRYPGPNFSYETFELKKGFHHLDGKTALKYARMRHDSEGDFGRAKRQQQVMQATKNKIFSTGVFLNLQKVNDLLNALGENVKTNASSSDMADFLNLLKIIDTQNINNMVLDAWKKESLLKVSHIFFENSRSFILVPRIGNWSEVEDLAQNIFDLNEIRRRREEISKENASVAIIDKSGSGGSVQKIQKLLKENFDYKNVVIFQKIDNDLQEITVIYDRTGGEKPFTSDELAKKLPAKIFYEEFPNYPKMATNFEADLVVVLGKDLSERYNMIEASREEYEASADANEYLELKK